MFHNFLFYLKKNLFVIVVYIIFNLALFDQELLVQFYNQQRSILGLLLMDVDMMRILRKIQLDGIFLFPHFGNKNV